MSGDLVFSGAWQSRRGSIWWPISMGPLSDSIYPPPLVIRGEEPSPPRVFLLPSM